MEKTGRDEEERETGSRSGLGEALLEKSLETAFSDPAMAVRLANLGVRLSLHLGEAPWVPGGAPGGKNRVGKRKSGP